MLENLMPHLSATEIATAVDGTLVNAGAETFFDDFHFDSRQLTDNALFFALSSAQADGHDYLDQVAQRTGCGAVVSQHHPRLTSLRMPLIVVDDPGAAYSRLAAWVRARLSQTRFIAITGSAGKTTTRTFAYQLLSSCMNAYTCPGNWNNWLGVPFALLKMRGDEEVAVFELGMSTPGIGEINRLAELLRPDITCVLNVLPVHLEYLKTLENVARGKLQINDFLGCDGVAVLNGDNDIIVRRTAALHAHKLYFGHRGSTNDVVLESVSTQRGTSELVISFSRQPQTYACRTLTKAQIENLFAAIVIAHTAGMTHAQIRRGLAAIAPAPGRGEIILHSGVRLIDETYNSNPQAATLALEWVAESFPQPRIAVLGDMLELGEQSEQYHLELGRTTAGLGFDLLITAGERAAAIAAGALDAGMPAGCVVCSQDAEEAGKLLVGKVNPGTTVLFKASRGVQLEQALHALVRSLPIGQGQDSQSRS